MVLNSGSARLTQPTGSLCLNSGQTAELCLSSCRLNAATGSEMAFSYSFQNQVSQSFSGASNPITGTLLDDLCPSIPALPRLSESPKLRINGGSYGRLNGIGTNLLQLNFDNLGTEQICISRIADECNVSSIPAVKASSTTTTFLTSVSICIPGGQSAKLCFRPASSLVRSLPAGNALVFGTNGYSEQISPVSRTLTLVSNVQCL